jgi:Leucine-rich repeat (LRR) protein
MSASLAHVWHLLAFVITFAALVALPVSAQTNAEAVLLKLFQDTHHTTNAGGWTVKTNWGNTSVSYCTWYGVTCNPVGDVTALRLPFNNLDGELPASVGTLTTLVSLDLSENSVGCNVSIFEPLVNLNELVLGYNVFNEPCWYPYLARPGCPAGVPDNGGNFIAYGPKKIPTPRGNFTKVMIAIPNLTTVTLTGLSVTLELTAASFCKHTNMQYVHFKSMPGLTGPMPECIGQLTQLRHITIAITNLNSVAQSFSTLSNLIRANLEANIMRGLYFPKIPPLLSVLSIAYQPGLTGPLPQNQDWVAPTATSISNLLEFYNIIGNTGTTGSFPQDLGTSKNMKVLYASTTQLTGTLPSNATWPRLLLLSISNTRMTGPIPDFYAQMNANFTREMLPDPYCPTCSQASVSANFTEMRKGLLFMHAANVAAGQLPPSLMRCPALTTLEFPNASLTNDLTDLLAGATLTSLTTLRLNGNKITGDLSGICGSTKLKEMTLEYNMITGVLPACLNGTTFSSLTSMYLANNAITGPITPGIVSMATLRTFDLTNNNLTGNVPNMLSMTLLQTLKVSNNSLTGLISDALYNLCYCQYLLHIDYSFNFFYGAISSFAWKTTTNTPQFPALKALNVANNSITGPLPDVFTSTRSQIGYFNFENNQISGVLPGLNMMDVIVGTGNAFSDVGGLPNYLKTLPYKVQTGDGSYECSVIDGVEKRMIVNIDPVYYGYRYCNCIAGTFGKPPFCKPCLENGICSGRDDSAMVIPAGFFPSPNATNPTHLVRCQDNPVRSENAYCNPYAEGNFTCSEGYEGRLCSKCVDNYYNRQSQCIKCPPLAVSIIALIALCLAVGIAVALLRFLPKGREELLIALKVLIVYIQCANAIIGKAGLRWPGSLMALNDAFDVINVDIRYLSCFAAKASFDLPMTAQVQSFVVIAVIILALLAFLFFVFDMLSWMENNSAVERHDRGKAAEAAEWNDRYFGTAAEADACERSVFEAPDDNSTTAMRRKFMVLRGLFLLLTFLYLPVAVSIMQVFQCDRDPGDGKKYTKYSPAEECDFSNSVYLRNFVLAIILLPTYIAGFPIFVAVSSMLFRRQSRFVVNTWFFLYQEYQRNQAPYLVWHVLRQLLLSIILILASYSVSIPLLLLLVFVMLMVHNWQQPFRLMYHNFLESVVLSAIILLLLVGLGSSGEQRVNEPLCAAILMILQILVLLTCMYAGAIHTFYRHCPRRECPWPLAHMFMPVLPTTSDLDLNTKRGLALQQEAEADLQGVGLPGFAPRNPEHFADLGGGATQQNDVEEEHDPQFFP